MLGMVATAPDNLALLLLGFAGEFRRSELVALDVADIRETETGLLATIRRSKTDQEGELQAAGCHHPATPAQSSTLIWSKT